MKTAITACAAVALSLVAMGSEYDDAAVSNAFVRTTGYFCGNGSPVESSLQWILDTCCEGDTNRYLRIAKDTGLSDPRFMPLAISIVDKFGRADDVPFLYQCTNELACASRALQCALKVGGLTEESIAAAQFYLANTNVLYLGEGCYVAESLMRCVAHGSEPMELKAHASEIALAYARTSRDVRYNDICFKNADPSYKYSKRRLSVLRAALPLCSQSDVLVNYTTNAINELVAYPESALPD